MIFVAVLVTVGMAFTAHADDVDDRVKQLTGSRDYKLRLTAALWLAKKQDPRAITALIHALGNDAEATVRQVAARSLGTLVDSATAKSLRRRAIDVLERAAKQDSKTKVRKEAARSAQRLSRVNSSGPRIFLLIGKPLLGKHEVPSSLDDDLESSLQNMVRDQAPDFMVSWPASELPTKAELERSKTQAFIVVAKIAELAVSKKGGKTEVACSVTMRVNPWEGRDGKERWAAHQTASATGNGRVSGASSSRGVDNAKLDCLLAVAEQVTAKQVIPFVKRVAAAP